MSWKPHTVVTEEVIQHGPVEMLSALFDDGIPTVSPGDELPPLWHWVALPRWPASTEIGTDGHPRRGSFLPPVELPRRMFAGGTAHLHQPIAVGAAVRREARVASVSEKTGRSGPLVIVVVETTFTDEHGRLALEERQDIIYREAASPAATGDHDASRLSAAGLTPAGSPLVRVRNWVWNFATDPTLLMRFSAATANPHRIHYDWPYATTVEGYPGLVVHGPLMTLALAEVVRLEYPAGRVERLSHRNLAPLFCGRPAQLRRTADGQDNSVDLGLFDGSAADPAATGPHTSLNVSFAHNERGSSYA
jgi:3-methylfumaryl-CoA hydratase